MLFRHLLTAALAVTLAFVAGGVRADEKPKDKEKAQPGHDEHFAACAKACAECMRECDSCAHHCAHMVADGKKDHLKTLSTCLDCGDICGTAARVTSRHGALAVPVCEGCAKSCDECAAACEKFPDDEHMKRCARSCRDCSKACKEMIMHAGHADKGKE